MILQHGYTAIETYIWHHYANAHSGLPMRRFHITETRYEDLEVGMRRMYNLPTPLYSDVPDPERGHVICLTTYRTMREVKLL